MPKTTPGKVPVYTYTPEKGDSPAVCISIDELVDSVRAMAESMEVGDELFIECGEMTPDEIEALPDDHPGW